MEKQELSPKKPETEKGKYKEKVVRVLSKDIEGEMSVYSGLTQVKGVSWGMSNAICKIFKIDRNRKIGSLTSEEILKISEFFKNLSAPHHLRNRRNDFESGDDKHLIGSELELQKDFDVKRLRKIKSYRGYRHASNLPLRGQRTKSNFRKNKSKSVGIKKKDKKK